jgi:glycosyltransferase involved in cell wall biosynthesis
MLQCVRHGLAYASQISAANYSARAAKVPPAPSNAGSARRAGRENALNAVTEKSSPAACTVTVIMPVYNGSGTLRQSLEPLLAMRRDGEIAEIIVVDDGSSDATAAIADAAGVTVLESGGRLGPGGARNVGAATATGEVLWFVDADVVVHADSARVLAEALQATGAAAVFGSYDDDPPAPNFFSQYKNLVHRYYHSQAKGDVDTFWAGCGAMTRRAFAEAGGFDADKYPYSSIEDLELGLRLRQRGLRIHLEPALLATHLKVWRLSNLLHTEIYRRAMPWSRLIVEHGWWSRSLNMDAGERLRAVLVACWLATLLLAAAGLAPAWPALILLAVIAVSNRRLFSYFRQRRGTLFAIGGVLYHQLYYIYSTGAFAYCLAAYRWSVMRRRLDRRTRPA